MAEEIGSICKHVDIPWVYKSCYDKDCRSSNKSFRGIGLEEGLKILSEVRDTFKIPVVSDFSGSDYFGFTLGYWFDRFNRFNLLS